MRLWIDDERPMPEDFTHRALTSLSAIDLIEEHREDFELVSFDHDLGILPNGEYSDDTSRPVMLYMIGVGLWPQEIRFHTANPVGREWLVGMAKRYAPLDVIINQDDPWRDPPGMRMGR